MSVTGSTTSSTELQSVVSSASTTSADSSTAASSTARPSFWERLFGRGEDSSSSTESSTSTSAESTASSATSVAETALDPVKAAAKKLNERTAGGDFGRFLLRVLTLNGFIVNADFIKYAGLDESHVRLIKATHVYSKTIKMRSITQNDAPDLQVKPANGKAVVNNARCEKARQEFYAAFKERVAVLNVTPEQQTAYAKAAEKLVESDLVDFFSFKRMSFWSTSTSNQVKLKAELANFGKLIYNDRVAAYAAKPLSAITIENFKSVVAEIKSVYPILEIRDIEFDLRTAIRTQHSNVLPAAIAKLQSPTSAEFQAIKEAVKVEKTQARDALEAECSALRGTQAEGSLEFRGGTIDTTITARDAAAAVKNEKRAAYVAALRAFGGISEDDEEALLATETNSPVVNTAKAAYVTAYNDWKTKAEAVRVNWDRFAELASGFGGADGIEITSGLVFDARVAAQDANIETAAREKANLIGDFYTQLNTQLTDPITDQGIAYRETAHNVLRGVIGQ